MAEREVNYSMHTPEGRVNIRLDSLPPVARRKYQGLRALAEDNAALTKTAMAREKAIEDALYDAQRRRSLCNPQDEPERAAHLNREVEDVQAELQRLNAARMRRESVRANTEQILAQLRYNFLSAEDYLFPQTRACTRAPAKPRDGEDLTAAITRIRQDISRVQAALTGTKRAPCTPAEAKAQVIAEVERLAAIGKPNLRIEEGGKVGIFFPDQQQHAAPGSALVAPSGSASAMMCWLFTDQIIQHAVANLDQIVGGISAADRKRKIADLEAELFQLETDEESLITQALDAGMEAHRRPYASGFALLGIEVMPPIIAPAPTPARRLNGNNHEDHAEAARQAAE
jgi:hypothetical protein